MQLGTSRITGQQVLNARLPTGEILARKIRADLADDIQNNYTTARFSIQPHRH